MSEYEENMTKSVFSLAPHDMNNLLGVVLWGTKT